jgi:hypothetical protein
VLQRGGCQGTLLTGPPESFHLARMNDIDRQRISGVKLLESLGYTFRGGEWQGPAAASNSPEEILNTAPI